MRIAAVVMEQLTNGIYRTWIPMQALAYRGHTVHVVEQDVVDDPSHLFEFDVVHFCRSFYGHMERLATRLRRAGVGVVWDNDDDLTAIPKDMPGYAVLGGIRGQEVLASIRKMMRIADVVTAPSEVLAGRYRELSGADVRVLENYLPPTFVRPERVHPHQGKVIVGWHAGPEHVIDVQRLGLIETLEHLLARHPQLEVATVGLNLGLRSHRYHHMPPCDYHLLPESLAKFDIGIAPLSDVAFNRARSNVKVKEYAATGTAWLASAVGPYLGLGADQGGHLVADDGWGDALAGLIADADRRRVLGQRALTWAAGERIEAHVQRWEEVLADATRRARGSAASVA